MAERSDPGKFPGDGVTPREVDSQEIFCQHPGQDLIVSEEGILDNFRLDAQKASEEQQANHASEQEDLLH